MKINEIKTGWVKWALALIILAGLVVRVVGAWQLRITTDPDSSVVALMAKHMALGLDYPWFFYGQLYMGSFEPAVSALICKIFGVSGFTVNLGTALISLLLLPIVYAWGRDAGGPVAGLAAAAFCIIGSPVFLQYQINPRGGYASVIMLGTLVMWMASRIASCRVTGNRPRSFLLGLVAGLAWWVDPLIVMALVAAVVVLLVGLRLEVVRPGFWFPGLVGFFLGGAPFWIWNAKHDWVGVNSLLKSESRILSEGMLDYLTRAQRATGLQELPPALWWLTMSLFAGGVLVALWQLAVAAKNRRADASAMATLGSVVLIISVFFIFSTSTFSRENTARYLLPMVPAVAVLAGLLVSAVARLHAALAFAPLAVVALMQLHSPQLYRVNKDYVAAVQHVVPILERVLPAHQINTVYIAFAQYPLNFHTDEAFVFPLLTKERCFFISEKAEYDPAPAYMTAINEIKDFIDTAGGSYDRIDLGTAVLLHKLNPPTVAWKPVPRESFAACTISGEPADIRDITDGIKGTYLYFRREVEKKTWAEIQFTSAINVCGLRMTCADKKLTPAVWSIEGQMEDGTWKVLIPDKLVTGMFWSGPRSYANGRFVRYDAQFETAKLAALRIVFPPGHQSARWGISELNVFEPSTESLEETEQHTDALLDLLRQRQITTLFSDRWMANDIWNRSGKTIKTMRELPHFDGEPETGCPLIDWSTGSGLVVRKDGADTTRHVLQNAAITATETEIGPWILFDKFQGSSTNIVWAGYAALQR
jgi:4-amino-4-deoxy-L-arabinose transferase-like glycosyltransferase